MKKAILEIPVPESCFACLLCLPSDTRSGLFCRAADLITDDYHSIRHPGCPMKIEDMVDKKDLFMIANELFPDVDKGNYDQLLSAYMSDGKTNINPTISFEEAIAKYTSQVKAVISDKNNWKNKWNGICIEFHNFKEAFEEFFPFYFNADRIPYIDIGSNNYANGKKIVEFLIVEIFYRNYTGMTIKHFLYISEHFMSKEFACIYLRQAK